jgi:hypothetical protein
MILARKKDFGPMLLKAWRGQEGFGENAVVDKKHQEGPEAVTEESDTEYYGTQIHP